MENNNELRTEKSYLSRAFLNKIEFCGGAVISTGIGKTTYEVEISDCQRSIRLHGTFRDEKAYENALFKLETIQKELEKAKEVMKERFEKVKKSKRTYKKSLAPSILAEKTPVLVKRVRRKTPPQETQQ